jgi:hypothetical protein
MNNAKALGLLSTQSTTSLKERELSTFMNDFWKRDRENNSISEFLG